MKHFLFLGILLVLTHGFFGSASAAEPTPVPTFDTIGLSWSPDASDQSCDTPATVYDPASFDHVFDGIERTSTLRLDGHQWDNTLVRNCKIHDTGGNGIFIKNVDNVVIQNCEIYNVENGVKTSSVGGSTNVVIDGCFIHEVSEDGIKTNQHFPNSIDTPGVIIRNNRITNVGLGQTTYGRHPLYIQTQDFLIENNTIYGARHGNGISIRSSGIVRCNTVSGTSELNKPGIRYFSDNEKGPSNLLVIEHNNVVSDTTGINLYKPAIRKYDGQSPPDHVAKNFIIRYNTVDGSPDIEVARAYDDPIYTVQVYDNPIGPNEGSASNECTVQYRELGSAVWEEGSPLLFDERDSEYRGSIGNLTPNTEYEIELRLQTGLRATFTAKTRASTDTTPPSVPKGLSLH